MPLSLPSFSSLFPGWALKRAQQRYALEALKSARSFELASPKFKKYGSGHDTLNLNPYGSSLRAMRNKSRQAVRNSPFVKRAHNVLADHVVGVGITPHVDGKSRDLRKLVEDFLLEPDVDAEGQCSILDLQHMFCRAWSRDGEALLIKVDDAASPLGFRIRLLGAEHLDTHKQSDDPKIVIKDGIEFNSEGLRVAYHLFPFYPDDHSAGLRSIRVSAENVYHGFISEEPGQIRGVPLGHASLVALAELEEYHRATLTNQKVAGAFGLVIEDNTLGKQKDSEKLTRIVPGSVIRTRPNSQAKTINPPQTHHFKDYTATYLRAFSAGYGIPYELITGDFSDVNYASFRCRNLDWMKTVRRYQSCLFVKGFCGAVTRWVMDSAKKLRFRIGNSVLAWSPQPEAIIDPPKEVPAKIAELRAGFDTLSNEWRRRGRNAEAMAVEIKATNELLDSHGIVLDSDPRKKDRNGQDQQKVTEKTANDDG